MTERENETGGVDEDEDEEINITTRPKNARGQALGYRRVLRSLAALQALRDIENEIREQASGSQDGYLLDVANRMRTALNGFQS